MRVKIYQYAAASRSVLRPVCIGEAEVDEIPEAEELGGDFLEILEDDDAVC